MTDEEMRSKDWDKFTGRDKSTPRVQVIDGGGVIFVSPINPGTSSD